MKLMFWTALVVLGMILVSHCGLRGQGGEGKMTVYYFPIGEETLTPVTPANIEERGQRCEIHTTKDISKIKNVLSSAVRPSSHKFSDLAVRVKLVEASDAGDRLFAIVDHEGEVRFSDGTEGMLSPRSMKTLKKLIEAQCNK